jgi:putative DNA primase/helicase
LHRLPRRPRHRATDFDSLVEQAGFCTPDELAAEQRQQAAEDALLAEGAHDEGNAQCVLLRHHNRFAYNNQFGWLQNTGTHWTSDGAEAALERAIVETLKARVHAALDSGEPGKHEIVQKCIPEARKVKGAKALLQSLVYVPPTAFDNEPDLLNCLNGIADLRTGERLPHSERYRFTYCINVAYHPDADSTAWTDYLGAAVGSAETVDWLQTAVGYSLTGHTNEEVLFYLYGPPRSGKGIFTETLLALLGSPLAKEVHFGTFTAQRTGDSQNFDLAPLKPCRFVAASESNQYERFNEAKLKALTGGNEVYCAHKHRTHFNYRPMFKIWLASNHPVNADPDDEAVWCRLRVIGFPFSQNGREDKSLKRRMRSPAVLEGVLAWAVRGAVRWYAMGSAGLPELEASRRLKNQQRGDLDKVQEWIDECCTRDDEAFLPSSVLYPSYETWCKNNGVEPKKIRGFGASLKSKGYVDAREYVEGGKQVRGFKGLRMI